MRFKVATIFYLAAGLIFSAFSEEASEVVAQAVENSELEAEINYVEALIDNGYPDFTAPIVEATKKRWPESEAKFFALEIRGLVALGKFDDAEKRLAALPDRKSVKYWAARLEIANGYFVRGQKPECMKIYNEFFSVFKTPTAEIRKFYIEGAYAFGQLLLNDRQYKKAAECYSGLLKQLPEGDDYWCTVACDTVDIYLRLAADHKDNESLKSADEIVDKLLWQLDKPVIFGRAVSMKAHIAEMKGDLTNAAAIIDEFKSQLQDIHDQIVSIDPEGSQGLLKQSPLPECLFLQAKMLWAAVKKAYAETPRDDEKVKSLMFGPKTKGGKRNFAKGCFAMFQSVFLNFETSVWAPAAGDMAQEVAKFTKEKYGKEVKTNITAEQLSRVRAAQFREANETYLQGLYEEAIPVYLQVLSRYPEYYESVVALENLATCYLNLTIEQKDNAAKCEEFRLNADVVEGYLAERFAGAADKKTMTAAGDATVRLAAKEQEYKNFARADHLYTEFFTNYRAHSSAAMMALSKASDLQKAERYDDAIKFWGIVRDCYSNTTAYVSSLAQLSYCYGRLGDSKAEIDYITRYIQIETVKLRRLQAQFQLAQMYQRDGQSILRSIATNEVVGVTNEVELAALVDKEERRGTAQIIRAIKNFRGFVTEAETAMKDPQTMPADVEKYAELKEGALIMIGECWGRMTRPEKNLEMYRKNAAKSFEDYIAAYPEGQYAKLAYVKLGTIYTMLGDVENSKNALDMLSKKYPDSDEAKNAKPRLAKSLIEMGMRKEGTEIYAEMLRTDGAYTAGQFVNAGEALIEARSWELANQAFEKAIMLAGSNQVSTVARSRLGQAKSVWKQGSLAEARDALDIFLSDPKMSRMAIAADANFMMVDIASEQGRREKDATMRTKYFNAAIGALKKVRQYWQKKPQWEQDQLDLLSGDVLVDRMKAEEDMGLKEEAMDTCGIAAGKFQVFIQSHGVSDLHPLDKMEAGELANLERAYSSMIPLFVKQGKAQADLVLRYGEEYLNIFPNGKARTLIENCINQARADMAVGK